MSRPADYDRPAGGPEGLIEAAHALFDAGEIRRSAEGALKAAEAATGTGAPHWIAEAALVVEGVPDPATAATVERMCRQALAAPDEDDADLRCRLEAQLAIALHHRERLEESQEHVDLATALAAPSADPRARAAALHARILAVAGRDAGPTMLGLADEMLGAAVASGSTLQELYARGWRIDGLMRSGDAAQVGHELDALDVLAARSSSPLVGWNALLARAGLDHAVGRFRESEALARAARLALPPGQRGQTEPLFIAQLMLVSTDRGSEPAEIGQVREMAIGAPLIVGAMLARYDLEIGDDTRAMAAYEALRPRLGGLGIDRRALPTLTAAAELAVAFDDRETARALLDRLEPFEGNMIASALGAVGPASCFLARLERALGDVDHAVDHAEAAVDMTARMGFGPWLARSRLELAACLVARDRRGDRDRARRMATLAAVAARELGMTALTPRAEALRERLATTRSLSPREREIAALVAGGSSNRDIAARLVLSDRTVETHVQNILNKLGAHARTQIAAWAIQEGLRPDIDR